MAKIRYDIAKKQRSKGRWKWLWMAQSKGRFSTIDEAIRAA